MEHDEIHNIDIHTEQLTCIAVDTLKQINDGETFSAASARWRLFSIDVECRNMFNQA